MKPPQASPSLPKTPQVPPPNAAVMVREVSEATSESRRSVTKLSLPYYACIRNTRFCGPARYAEVNEPPYSLNPGFHLNSKRMGVRADMEAW